MSQSTPPHAEQTGLNTPRPALLRGLIPLAHHETIAQVDAFASRLANALLAHSEQCMDSRIANLSFHAGQLLKKNVYAFYHIAAVEFEKAFEAELRHLLSEPTSSTLTGRNDQEFSLVSYEEMDQKLALSRVSRTIELDCAEEYAALNIRLAHVLCRDTLGITQNPFRPDVFLRAIVVAWCTFDPEKESHDLILPLFRTDILFDIEPILATLNHWLIDQGVLPDLQESYRIQRNHSQSRRTEKHREEENGAGQRKSADPSSELTPSQKKLKEFLSGVSYGAPSEDAAASYQASSTAARHAALFRQLEEVQKSSQLTQLVAEAKEIVRLSALRDRLSESIGTGVEKHTLDLLANVFDHVFSNPAIPTPVKELISLLQIPVLKAALIDKNFFFQEQHPARRLIDLLSRYSPAVDEQQAKEDPLFQAMQKNVHRVTQEFDREVALFDEVIRDLETHVANEEQASNTALQAPIQKALRKEKIKQASLTANHEVAVRIGTGEVVAFVETFLENRWTKVLTLAYTVQEEKPHAVADAIQTMDDLIWSVKPKITLQERQELLHRLPAILARLNKWLSLIKWEDTDRIQFFADLAECHAAIVRAPLELSPQRQLELAVEAAQHATERRLEKRAAAEKAAADAAAAAAAVPPIDAQSVTTVAQLERGIWLEFKKENDEVLRVRLAWVSPMRSLYIFTSSQKEKSFSITATELEKAFSEQRVHVLMLDHVVDRALTQAIDTLADKEVSAEAR